MWLQVETKDCFEDIDNIFSVPGIHCGFLGAFRGGGLWGCLR